MGYLKTACCLCSSLLLLAGCDNEWTPQTGDPVEVRFSVFDNRFVQTRAGNEIGKDGTGPQYGTIYIRKTPKADPSGPDYEWARYKVANGQSGSLVGLEDEKLFWTDMESEYYFQAVSVPTAGNDPSLPGRVTFTRDGHERDGYGTVTFGGYDTGLEYFVGGTSRAQNMTNGVAVRLDLARQVVKIIFRTIKHIDANGKENLNLDQCEIIFPNLPTSATFDLEHMYRTHQLTMDPEPIGVNGRNYICLTESETKGVEMIWKKAPLDNPNKLPVDDHQSKTQAIYLPTFQLWDGKDNKPENQSGFFIVRYNGMSYTGCLEVKTINNQDYIRLWAGDLIRVDLTLRDGPISGGGNGSVIADWNMAAEQDVPHYPVPGIYTADNAQALLAALRSGGKISERFYREEGGKRVIPLFTNVDWSALTGPLTLPEGYALAGQGYNITLGAGGSIGGDIETPLYVDGKPYVR